MLDSKLIWIYFQSNSIPLAPTHNGNILQRKTTKCCIVRIQPSKSSTCKLKNNYMYKVAVGWLVYMYISTFPILKSSTHLVTTSSAAAHPKPATMNFSWPFPAILVITKWMPTRSAKSTVDFRNSCHRVIRNIALTTLPKLRVTKNIAPGDTYRNHK